jgi:polysaccharide biosynthesis protein PslG
MVDILKVKRWRLAGLIAFFFLLFAVLLGLDLFNRGLAWQFFWSQTGEEEPLAQVRGMIEWVGNLTRPQPINDPLIPMDHANVNPYGINTFLHQEVDPAKVEEQLRLISDAGFRWIREEFTWEEIEVDGRGQFTDSRNDMDGDGTPDTISGWAKFDRIVDLAEQYGIRIQARLSNPPAWAQAEGVHTQTPPVNVQDYVNFITAAAERYRGRVNHFQIWNEPNIFPEWGADTADGSSPRAVNPEEYTALLCASYRALKAVDSDIVVISGALAPTSELGGVNLNDFVFLERMYQADAGECFDVLSMQGYGLNSGPTDRRMRPTTVNFGRSQYIRDLMVQNGDAAKPIWISEAAWNPVPTESDAPSISNRLIFGQVTQQQAAVYMSLAYQRMQQEWPWVAVMNYWYFTQPSDMNKGSSWYYFRMAEPDYSEEHPTYTTLPVYESMKTYIKSQTPTLYQGVHQLDSHWAVRTDEAAQVITVSEAQFDDALQASGIEFNYQGTDLMIRWQGGKLQVKVDDRVPIIIEAEPGHWRTTLLHGTLFAEAHQVNITSLDDMPIVMDAIMVIDQSERNWIPVFSVVGALIAVVVSILFAVIRFRQRRLYS